MTSRLKSGKKLPMVEYKNTGLASDLLENIVFFEMNGDSLEDYFKIVKSFGDKPCVESSDIQEKKEKP